MHLCLNFLTHLISQSFHNKFYIYIAKNSSRMKASIIARAHLDYLHGTVWPPNHQKAHLQYFSQQGQPG